MTNHQSKPNKITMHPLIIVTLLIVCSTAVKCKPNQQQQSRSAADSYDKQLIKKQQHQVFNEDINPTQTTSGAQNNATFAAAAASSNAAAVAAAAALSSNIFQCPEQFGYYTDARDCTKYYVCVFGEVLHESCTGGLRFSRELQTCDWPRNVDCPQASTSNSSSLLSSSSSTTASNSTPIPTTTTTLSTTALATSTSNSPPSSSSMATTTTPGSSTSLTGGHNRHHQHHNQHHNHNHNHPQNAKESSSSSSSSNHNNNNNQDSDDRSLKSSASLVFADEGSDPQQPSFDEAASPVITPDGTIHVHDGSGGTFGLTPNHNRADHNQQQPQENQRPNNVDVFVKPIQLASPQQQQQQQQVTNQGTSRTRGDSGDSNRHQLLSSSNPPKNPNQRQAGSMSKLQAATLPEQRRGRLIPTSSQSNLNLNKNENFNHHYNQHQSQLQAAHSILGNDGNHFASNKNSANNHDDNQASSRTTTSLDSESVNNGDEPPNDSIGAQADQESYEELNGQLSGEDQSSTQQSPPTSVRTSQEHPHQQQQQQQQQQQAGYIPPVMANAPRTMSGQQVSSLSQPQVAAGGRQSSQLLSFNNRQVQDSRQLFKPILLSSSSATSHSASSSQHLTSGNDEHNLGASQRSGQQQAFALPTSNMPFENGGDEDDPQQEDQTIRPSTINNNQLPHQQQQQQQMQQQQNSNNIRQQSGSSSTRQNNQQQQHPQMNPIAGFTDRQQNNRQSRMSANFNQQPQPVLFTTSVSPITLAGAAAGERQPHHLRATFLAAPDNQIMSNNVNFNDSSKLIRLQASHFEQLPPSSTMLDHNNNINNNQQQQPGLVSSFVPKFPSRSQNVLFSQHPFGFMTDQSNGGHDKLGSSMDRHLSGSGSSSALHQLDSPLGVAGRQANGDGSRLLHQQRRPRPPKRQQIPSGAQRRPSQQQVIATSSGHQHLANQQLRPNQLLQIDSDGISTTPTTTSQPPTTITTTTTGNGNSFLSPHDASFMEMVDDEQTEQPPGALQPVTRATNQNSLAIGSGGGGGGSSSTPIRPIVAPTTVNFQQQDAISSSTSSGFETLPTTFATTPSSGRMPLNGRRFNDAIGLGNSRTGTNPVNGLSNNQMLIINQGQRSGNEQSIAPQGNALALPTSSSILPITTTPTTSTSSSATATSAAANQQDQQDPQLIANRYLNSAIDALEAGQPFGAVDYDFDILNDNSTDRRNPTSSAAVGNQLVNGQSNNNSASLFNSNANANRQRQQLPTQRLQATFGSGNVVDEEGENISLINGQPSGRASLNTRQQQAGNSGSGRSRTTNLNGQQQVSTGTTGRQQAAVNNQQFGGQQQQQADLFSGANPPSLASSPSPSSQSNQQLKQQQQATKKPRPTNRKIAVNHEQALANTRASTEPAKRPEALFSTPIALQTATKCDNRHCRLPDCKCGDTLNPAGLDPKVIPQVVLLTFDDAVNDLNWEIYEELFTGRTNPNGCPILATFYVSHEWTDYGQVQTLYSRGHEMASHSVTHSFGEKFSKSQWFKEVNGQREILNMYGGVKMNDVRGMRAPFLQIGGNKMFEMLYDANFTYDSSMPIFENSPPLWPYTLDYQLTHECMITPCPTKSFPGVWEVGMTMWVDLRGGRCSMGDACSNPPDEDGVYEMLMKNFNRHYKSNRAPFGLFYHSAWFNTVHHRRGFLRFMGTVNSLSDVFFVTNWQMLQWMRQPTPISEINSFEPWQCPAKNDRPPPCFHPSVCNVKSEHGTRFMKTCQPCPVNQQYPWVGSTGFKGKQQASGSG